MDAAIAGILPTGAWVIATGVACTGLRPAGRYNPGTMRRWFTAIFALLFVVSVGLFAFDQADAGISTPAAHEMTQAAVPDPVDPAHEDDLLGHAPNHGLTDSQPELPELMHLDVVAITMAHVLGTPAAPLVRPITLPMLNGLKRPPRDFARA